jgi:mannose-6-phosphate isomerase
MNHTIVVDGGNMSPVISEKSWGFEKLFGVTPRVALKQVTVRPNEALSKQVHLRKDEVYLVIEGRGQLELGRGGEIMHELSKGDVVHVPPGVVHRLVAGSEGIVIIEASTPELTDIIRLDDRYHRPVNDKFDPQTYRESVRG